MKKCRNWKEKKWRKAVKLVKQRRNENVRLRKKIEQFIKLGSEKFQSRKKKMGIKKEK